MTVPCFLMLQQYGIAAGFIFTDPSTDLISVEAQGEALKTLTCFDCSCKQDKQTFLEDSGRRKGTNFTLVPHCYHENRHKDDRVGDVDSEEGHPGCDSQI